MQANLTFPTEDNMCSVWGVEQALKAVRTLAGSSNGGGGSSGSFGRGRGGGGKGGGLKPSFGSSAAGVGAGVGRGFGRGTGWHDLQVYVARAEMCGAEARAVSGVLLGRAFSGIPCMRQLRALCLCWVALGGAGEVVAGAAA